MRSAVKYVAVAGGALLALFALEAGLSGTALITPIDPRLLTVMRVIGALLGLALALAMLVFPQRDTDRLLRIGIGQKLLALLFLPLLVGFLFDGIAWRIADRMAFGLSDQPFVTAVYPIEYYDRGRRGATDAVEIDPFGTRRMTEIPIPRHQYEEFWMAKGSHCITVEQRRAPSGAIEIRTDGTINLSEPAPAAIAPCPAGVRSRTDIANERLAQRAFRP